MSKDCPVFKCSAEEIAFCQASTLRQAAGIVLERSASGNDKDVYQNYCKLDRLLQRIVQKRWWLTRCSGAGLNDRQEPKKYAGKKDFLKRSYITCFSHDTCENVAMWGLYGKNDPMAVRVTIPGDTLRRWMNGIEFKRDALSSVKKTSLMSPKDENSKAISAKRISSVAFSDLLYVAISEKEDDELDRYDIRRYNSISWRRARYYLKKDKDERDVLLNGQYAGFVKDVEWRYENETRLLVRLKKTTKDKRISIAIPPYVIEAMRFTFSPWLTKSEEEDRVKAIIEAALTSVGVNVGKSTFQRFRRSALQGALNFN